MAAPRLVLALVGILLLAGVPWAPADAYHLPAPPYPCHPRGCTEWERIETPGRYDELTTPLPDLAHERLYAVGRNDANGMFVMAFDTTSGSLAYRVDWASPLGLGMTPYGAAISADGATIAVTGALYTPSNDTNRGPDLVVVAFDAATGNARWMSRFDEASSFDEGHAVAIDGQRVYALGYSDRNDDICYASDSAFSERAQAVAFDLGTGALVWHARDTTWRSYGGFASKVIVGSGGAIHFAQTVHPCASTRPGPSATMATMLWTVDGSTGATIWNRTFTESRSADDWLRSFVASPDRSRLFVGGWANTLSGGGTSQGTLGAFEASNGATVWSDILPTTSGSSLAHALTLSPDGTQLLVASSEGGTTRVAIRSPGTGASQWSGVSSPSWNGEPWAAAFSADGSRAYVSGPGNSTTYTASFEPSTGRVVWTYTVPVVAGRYHSGPLGVYPTTDGLHVLSVAPSQDSNGERDIVARSAAVIAPPEPPVAAAAPAGIQTIRVSWTPPFDDGGRPITSYIVTRSGTFRGVYQQIAEVDGDTRSYDDPGRAIGVYYFYTVAALNDVGLGAPSQIVSAKASGLPGAPVNVKAVPGFPPLLPSVVVTWQPPASDGGSPITGYTILRYEPSGAITTIGSVGPTIRSFQDTGPRILAPYTYGVTASNAAGAGPAGVSSCTRASPVGTVTTLVGQPCILADQLAGVEPLSPV